MRCRIYIILVLALSFFAVSESFAQDEQSRVYSNNSPLIFEDAPDYWPYSFVNEEGDPRGYNVDLVKTMLDRLDIPYVIRLKYYGQVKTDIQEGNADLTCTIKGEGNDNVGVLGNSVLVFMTHSVMASKKTPVTIRTLNDMRDQSVYVHSGGFLHNMMKQYALDKNAMPYGDMKDLCLWVSRTDSGKVAYDTKSLEWIIKKYKLDNVRLTPINMPYAEYHFMSRDTVLLARLDSLYEVMSKNGELKPLQEKWLSQGKKDTSKERFMSTAGLYAFFIIGVGILIVVYYRVRMQHVKAMNNRMYKMYSLYLDSANITLWQYNVDTDTFKVVDIGGKAETEYTQAMFAQFYNSDDFVNILKAIDNVASKKVETEHLHVRYHIPNDLDNELYFNLKILVQKEVKGAPRILLGIQQDMTDKRLRARKALETHTKFQTLFDSISMDLFYFDKNGELLDLNKTAMSTFGIEDKKKLLESKPNIKDMPMCRPDIDNDWFVSRMMNFKADKLFGVDADLSYNGERMYYECMSSRRIDLNDEFVGMFVAGHDQTDIVENQKHTNEQINLISSLTSDLRRLMYSVDRVLHEMKAYQAKYDVKSRNIVFNRIMLGASTSLTELDFAFMLSNKDRDKALRVLKRMDKGVDKRFNLLARTLLKDTADNPVYYNIDAVPMHDKDGNVTYYHCLVKDETERMCVQHQLESETKKAYETERLQDFFIKNMSYEIRVPLNSIIGFSELFEIEHDVADEAVFVEQIKDNTKKLLDLVNDILLLSSIEADLQEINIEDSDVVGIFNTQCAMGWDTILKPGVRTIVECPYALLYGPVDVNNFGMVIYNMCMLAAMNTTSGFVKASMDYHHGKLYIKITDTGKGFDNSVKEKMMTLARDDANRDYRIELKLMICKQMIEKMGGAFEIESVVGQGTTVWLTIPFNSIEIVMNTEIEAANTANASSDTSSAESTMDNSELLMNGSDLLTNGSDLLLSGDDSLLMGGDSSGSEEGSFLDSLGF